MRDNTKYIIEKQIVHYRVQYSMATTDADKDKYAELVMLWDRKLGEVS